MTSAAHRPFVAACVQLRAGREVAPNVEAAAALIAQAADDGADFILTPENTSIMEAERKLLFEKTRGEDDDIALTRFRALARDKRKWLLIGSLPIKVAETKLANRSLLIGPDGRIAARYDKIHMFDVDLAGGESYRESRNFAHWHVLLRARAIETGAFVFAPAQGGRHENGRETFGHSLIVAPWGEIIAEAGTEPGVVMAEIDPAKVDEARGRVPSLQHDKSFEVPVRPAPAKVAS